MRSYSRTAVLSLSSLLLVGGLALKRWELVACIVPLVTMIFLETQYRFPTQIQVRAEVEDVPDEVLEGDDVDLAVRLVNEGADISQGEVCVSVPNGLRLTNGHRTVPVSLPSGGDVRIVWSFRVESGGRHRFAPLRLRVADAFHLFERSVLLEIDKTFKATLRPEPLSRVNLRPASLRPHIGSLRAGMVGQGSEFFALREHRPGDQLREVNWKATARRDRVMSNAREDERSGDMLLLLDLQAVDGRLHHRCVQAAAGISSYWLRERNRVGMIVLSEHVGVVPMGSGRRQLYRVRETLMELSPRGNRRAPLSAENAWKRYFTSDPLIVMISPLMEPDSAVTVKRMVRQGANVLLLFPYQDIIEEDKARELAERVRAMGRSDLLYDLLDFCRVVEWEVSSPLSRCFLKVIRW